MTTTTKTKISVERITICPSPAVNWDLFVGWDVRFRVPTWWGLPSRRYLGVILRYENDRFMIGILGKRKVRGERYTWLRPNNPFLSIGDHCLTRREAIEHERGLIC